MKENFLWTDDSTLVNFQAIAYVKIEAQEARIVFSNGEKISVDAQHLISFREFLTSAFLQTAEPMRPGSGVRSVKA
jgi:hypothetical protein